jgi:methylated-DNA-[protein]-cysteine S-methyltransferase
VKTRIFKRMPNGSHTRKMDSPLGPLHLVASDGGLHAILWQCDLAKPETAATVAMLPRAESHPVSQDTERQLAEYFRGERQRFDLPLAPMGTPFQRAAWQALLDIPYGGTTSYEAQAIRLGGREKTRAVGTANGMNPVSIVVPCHRVVGKDGSLTGFGGGLDAKRWLLNLEGAHHPALPRLL